MQLLRSDSRDAVQLHDHREIQICFACLDWLNAKRGKHVARQGGIVRIVGTEPIFTVGDVARAVDPDGNRIRFGSPIPPRE